MIGGHIGTAIGISIGVACGLGAEVGVAGGTTLTVSLADSTNDVLSGANFDYTATVNNTGGSDASTVTATLTLSANVTYVSGSGAGWAVSHSLGVVTATRATITAGASPTFTVTVTASNNAETVTTTLDADADNSSPAAQDSEATSVVLTDGPDAWYMPRNAAQAALAGYAPNSKAPSSLHIFTEAASPIVDKIGSMNLTSSGSPSFQQTRAGWTRQGVLLHDGTSNEGLRAVTADSPDPATESVAYLVKGYLINTPAHNANIAGDNGAGAGGDAEAQLFFVGTDGKLRNFCSSGGGSNTSVAHYVGTAKSFVAYTQYNRTASTFRSIVIYNGTGTSGTGVAAKIGDYITGQFFSPSRKDFGVGAPKTGGTTYAADANIFELATWKGASAEHTDAEVQTIFSGMGASTIAFIPFDGPQNLLLPVTAAQFTALSLTAPTEIHTFQESGASDDAIGQLGVFDLADGTTCAQNTNMNVSGWITRSGAGNRKCFDLTHNNGNSTISATHPDVTGSLHLVGLTDVYTATNSTQRVIFNLGGAAAATEVSVQVNVSAGGVGRLRLKVAGTTTDGTQLDLLSYRDNIVGCVVDWTHTKVYAYAIDVSTGNGEMIEGTWSGTITDGTFGWGVNAAKSPAGQRPAYDLTFEGTSGEFGSTNITTLKAAVKAYFERLRVPTITWL